MTDLKPSRPDIEIQSLCRELRQQGYLVPYTVMAKATQNAAISLAPTVQEAAKALLDWHDSLSDVPMQAGAAIAHDRAAQIAAEVHIDPAAHARAAIRAYLESISGQCQ